jgi:TolB protein
VLVVVRNGADSLSGSQLELTVNPVDGADVAADGTLTFKLAGPLNVSALLPGGTIVSGTIDVAIPPTIVFDLSVNGNRDIYSAALDGGDLMRLTTAGGDDVHPSVAAGMMVFSSFRDGEEDLYALPLAGGLERRLTTTPENESAPALSPDGGQLAYVSDSGGVGRIRIANSDATNTHRLTAVTSPSPEAAPSWSPDGRLVFTSTEGGGANLSVAAAAEIATMPTLLAAANSSAAEVDAAWSPDGTRIAFISDRTGLARLYLLDLTTSHLVPITSAGDDVAQPAWLPDGRIVYATFLGSTWRLHWVDPSAPGTIHDIPLPAGDPQHPAPVR